MRSLEREIGSICRKVAREFAEGTRTLEARRSARDRDASCSASRASSRRSERRTSEPGVATGLAWTPVGGDVLFVEATAYPGDGKLQITGQLGDVMKESAAAALSYVQATRRRRASPEDWFREHDIHVHVPGRRDPEGRAERGRHDGHRARVARHRPAGARRHGDDRRDHADRAGAADRRPQGEGARRPARRHQAADHPAPQRGATSTTSPSTLRKRMKFMLVDTSTRCSTRRSRSAPRRSSGLPEPG